MRCCCCNELTNNKLKDDKILKRTLEIKCHMKQLKSHYHLCDSHLYINNGLCLCCYNTKSNFITISGAELSEKYGYNQDNLMRNDVVYVCENCLEDLLNLKKEKDRKSINLVEKVIQTGQITDEELKYATNEELVDILTMLPLITSEAENKYETLAKVKEYILYKLNSNRYPYC